MEMGLGKLECRRVERTEISSRTSFDRAIGLWDLISEGGLKAKSGWLVRVYTQQQAPSSRIETSHLTSALQVEVVA